MQKPVFLAGSARTPIGSFCGALNDVTAQTLGSTSVKATLERTGVSGNDIDEVIFGNVIGAGLGQNIARQVLIGAGLPEATPGLSINKVCGSGLKSIMLAAQSIQCGDTQVAIAGGTENMSRAPYLLPKARQGYRMGNGEIVDSMVTDGLWDVYNDKHMGMCGDDCAQKCGFTRDDQDDFAVASYERARAATAEGKFADEIVPVEVVSRKSTVVVDTDEEPQRFVEEKLRGLRPAFGKEGTVTAGNASSINDGAASVMVLDEASAERLNVTPEARIIGYAQASREPQWFTLAPILAMQSLLKQLSMDADQIDLYEINEAFSVVTMAAMKELAIPREKVNVHGGATALGHPIGASGTRILVTLLHALRQRDQKIGMASLCIGGGEAVALAVERLT